MDPKHAEQAVNRLRNLPFTDQLGAIDLLLTGRGGERELVERLAEFRDHQPLAHAVAVLARRDRIGGELAGQVAALLLGIADAGLRRVLRALDELPEAPRALSEALAAGIDRLPVERIAALSLVDRWLKNAAPDIRSASVARALAGCRELIVAGRAGEIGDAALARIPGADYGELERGAEAAGTGDAWRARLARFAGAVIEALEAQPKSLSQASAEELLARRVYTDPGHFLVELLQNADDAGARIFAVTIDDDRVTIEHDGVPFDARDVVGVLSIGQTTKSSDQIGFFGVGFKSVYEICERPQVYSGPFAFEIADVSIPRPLARHPAARADRTLLVLPLRAAADPDRHPDRLYERVLSLPAEVLLTLNRVERIEAARGGRRRELAGDASEPGRVRLIEDGRSRAYAVERGTGHYPGRREAHRAESTPFLVAIAVDAEGRARPVDGPTIYSHLPTGERSGLRFLLHARFDVPLDRERLDLSSPWNRWALLESAPLFARAVADLAARGGDGVLGVIPLPEELADDAYRDLARAVASALVDVPLLRGAGGELLAPRAALTAGDPRLARALAGVDVGGRRVLGPLGRRDTEVAHMLGARPLTGDDVVAAIARDAASRDGDRFEAPWGATGLAELAEVIGPDDSIDVASLAAARFLPDHEGRARRPSELLRATGELAELLAGVRPLVAGELAGPGAARLLDRVGARAARTQDLVDQLLRPDAAAAIVASAGAARVLAHLAAAPPGDLVGVRAARVVPVESRREMPWRSGPLEPRRREVHEGGPASSKVSAAEHGGPSAWPQVAAGGSALRDPRAFTVQRGQEGAHLTGIEAGPPLAAIGEVWLTGEGPLADAVRALATAPPLCDRAIERDCGAWLRLLGARSLDLNALVDLVAGGQIAVSAHEAGRFHAAIDAAAGHLAPSQGARLARVRIFPDQSGAMRALRRDSAAGASGDASPEADDAGAIALLAEDDEVRSFWPGPWLRSDVAALAYVRRLGVEAVGPDAMARALAGGELRDERRRRLAFAYLTARGARLATERAEELAAAPIWPDAAGRLRRLSELRRESPHPTVAALYRLWPRAAAVEAGEQPGSALGLARALGLDHLVVEPGFDTAIEDLVSGAAPAAGPFRGEGTDLLDLDARPDIEAAVVATLREAAGELPRARLERGLDAPIYRARDGQRMRLGRWAAPSPQRCHRGDDHLDRALSGGSYPILDAAAERQLSPFLDACGVRPATVIDLAGAYATGAGVDPDAARAVRAALVGAAGDVAALDPVTRARVAQLPIWPAVDGRLLAAERVLRGADLDALLPASAADWRAQAPWEALLSDEAGSEAASLAGAIAFADATAALGRAVVELARPDQALAEQVPLLASVARVAEVAAAFIAHGRADLTAELPVGVDADGKLVARRLLAASEPEAELMRGLPLRAQLADADWARRMEAAAPGAIAPVSVRQLTAALLAAGPDPVRPDQHPSLSSPDRRAVLHRWLLARADDIAGDEQARGALGRAAVIISAGGWLRPPRELLFDPELPDLGIDWNPAAEVPGALATWLRATYRPGSKQLAPLVDHLLDAADQAIAAGDGARLAELLHHLARSLGAERADELAAQAQRFRLRRRLRVETDGGLFARPRSLLALDPIGWDLVERFADPPPPRVSPRYRDLDQVLRLCRAAGAEAELDEAALERELDGEGVRAGHDAALALACYAALVATRRPELRRRLRLDERAWVPSCAGELRRPGELYRPGAGLEEIVGPDERLFPHPELALRIPDARAWISFRGPDRAALEDVAAHVTALRAGGGAVPDAVLRWLDDGLADGRLSGPAVRDALAGCAFLRDDGGRYRRAEHLVLEGGRALFGERRGDFAGAGVARLVAALRIARRPGKREVVGFLTEIAEEVAGGADLLASDPALAERLPRCLDILVDAGGQGPDRLPIVCEGDDGYVIALLPDGASSIGFDGDAPLYPVLADSADAEAWRSYLRVYGVGEQAARDRAKPAVEARSSSVAPGEPGRVEDARQEPAPKSWRDRIADFFRGEREDDEEEREEEARREGEGDRDREPERDRDPEPERERGREPDRGRERDRDRKPDRRPDRDRPHASPDRGQGQALNRRGERPRPPPRSTSRGSGGDGDGAVDQRGWFRPDRRLGPQLRASPAWLDDRRRAAEFGLAHSPRGLPSPYLYAPIALFADFHGRQQSWDQLAAHPEWRRGGEPAGRVSMKGRVPAGAAVLPLPLYGRVLSVDADDARLVDGEDGAAILVARDDAVVSLSIELGEAPDFTAAEPARGEPDLLRPTASDDELPDEVHALVDRFEQGGVSAFERAIDIRDFVRTRYAYDPTYLEDPGIAAWLRQRARGRSNEHIAALHAGGDAEHLGRGVCYELNMLACELLRRAGIPAAIATGWTFDRGFVDEPDHLFAMALLQTAAGPRWLPLDSSTTQTGRPLHAGHRPPGNWRPPERGAAPPPAPASMASARTAPARASTRIPIGELVRVARYIEDATGRHLGSREELDRACRELLRDPQRSAELAALLARDDE